MKRCCLERKAAMDLVFNIAALFENQNVNTLSEKESKILNFFIENGLGKVYNINNESFYKIKEN
jgi:hypothetical protein